MSDFYFAYGSNMSTRRLAARIAVARVLGPAQLEHHRVVFDKVSVDGSGKANLARSPGSVTWGVVFRLAAGDWRLLDDFEPGYERHACRVTLAETGRVDAQIYISELRSPEIRPFAWYVDHVLEGAREHALPNEYVTALALAAR